MEVEQEAVGKATEESKRNGSTPFKRPVLIGKIGKLPRKIASTKNADVEGSTKLNEVQDVAALEQSDILVAPDVAIDSIAKHIKAPAQQLTENLAPLPYKEPSWSGLPHLRSKNYVFEVLKSGVIVEQINLMTKPFWVFGRSANCDIYMAHPTISRYHAVLQYRHEGTDEDSPGFYIYDLNSTHGTFLNKGRLKPRVYAPVKVGHMIKVGFSTRSYVLTGPDEDAEEESEFSVTELKQQRAEKLLKQELAEKEALLKEQQEQEEQRKKDEERGVDWGLGEDADEETDVAENPYAQTNNEELYLSDPKKALRGFMEREGYDLEYDCSEQGFGQFLCKVELPLDDDRGRPIVAEVLHKGKKKEAVVQCALEACRILDRYGVLRQATHESRKRKTKNWEENDYYDSDDDTFLDRTGVIEKKREKRMKSKMAQQPETYQTLLEKEVKIRSEITKIEKQLSIAKMANSSKMSGNEEDSLDSFMKELAQAKPDKQTISKMKSELAALKIEHTSIVKLANLAKPADLPPLVTTNKNFDDQQGSSGRAKAKMLPLFGKRLKLKLPLPVKPITEQMAENICGKEEEEVEENEAEAQLEENPKSASDVPLSTPPIENENDTHLSMETEQEEHTNRNVAIQSKTAENMENIKKNHVSVYLKVVELEKWMTEHDFPILENHIAELKNILQEVKKLLEHEGRIQNDKKTISARNRKVKKHIDNLMENYDECHFMRIDKELRRIYVEIQEMAETQHIISSKIRILRTKTDLVLSRILQELKKLKEERQKADTDTVSKLAKEEGKLLLSKNEPTEELPNSDDDDEGSDKHENKQPTPEELEKRKKKNLRRMQHRKERAEIEKQKGYQEDAQREDYNMWVPPQNQTGDGRTSLNEKFGY